MAEIRSTLDMVMERAARMAARAQDVPAEQEIEQRGMRFIADFLSGKQSGLTELLEKASAEDQPALRLGMAKALIRNIVIPRDDMLMNSSATALTGLLELSGEKGNEVEATCTELTQLLEQYAQHKEQVKQQLDDAIRTQLAQQLQEQTGEAPDPGTIDPTMHPQYQKEWTQAQTNLNDQYTQAFDERKELLLQRFSG